MSVVDWVAILSMNAIWLLMMIQMFLSIGGFIYYMKVIKKESEITLNDEPMVSVLIPAHNEGIVILNTLNAILNFDYPSDKIEIIVINDCSSDDSEQRLTMFQQDHPNRMIHCIHTTKQTGGRGKSNALNIGLKQAKGSIIAIYDADNTPEPKALSLLVATLLEDEKIGAVVGKFRARNKDASLMSRFVNLETLSYQCMNQAGRYYYFKLCTIPGTNYVIRRPILDELGGFDVKALSEDTEISFQLYRKGYYIKMMPLAVTWEQEPHRLKIWFKQRTRWAKGNLYVLVKNFKYVFDPSAGRMRLDVLYYFLVYFLMLTALICSDIVFILGLLGYVSSNITGFSSILWILAVVVFVVNLMITIAPEKDEFHFENIFLIALMLFTYAKLWVFVVMKALWLFMMDILFKKEVKWDKTVRYDETTHQKGR